MSKEDEAIKLLENYKEKSICLPYSERGKEGCKCCARAVETIDQALALIRQPANNKESNLNKKNLVMVEHDTLGIFIGEIKKKCDDGIYVKDIKTGEEVYFSFGTSKYHYLYSQPACETCGGKRWVYKKYTIAMWLREYPSTETLLEDLPMTEPCPKCKGAGQVGKEQSQHGRSVGWKECPECEIAEFVKEVRKYANIDENDDDFDREYFIECAYIDLRKALTYIEQLQGELDYQGKIGAKQFEAQRVEIEQQAERIIHGNDDLEKENERLKNIVMDSLGMRYNSDCESCMANQKEAEERAEKYKNTLKEDE